MLHGWALVTRPLDAKPLRESRDQDAAKESSEIEYDDAAPR